MVSLITTITYINKASQYVIELRPIIVDNSLISDMINSHIKPDAKLDLDHNVIKTSTHNSYGYDTNYTTSTS